MGKYSETLMDHFTAPRNAGRLENPDLVGRAGTPGHGPSMVVYLRVDGDRIVRAGFETHGCGVSIAAGSALTELVIGLTVTEGLGLTAADVATALEGVPADKLHCPILAIAALRDALVHYAPGVCEVDG